MGRPPCCDKDGVKKGPWTPEEDIVLVSYVQEHGPGNWRSVPTNTGLLRCSKSCRLRWTNYLRPGIKRGNFTPHEEGMIIHLQALLGNKWAAIASYLPQRTDNDIKNYWNTHLKKKLNRYQTSMDPNSHHLNNNSQHHHHPNNMGASASSTSSSSNGIIACVHNNSTSPLLHTTTNSSSLTSSSYYASSTENISRLLEGWLRTSPNPTTNKIERVRTFEHESYCEDIVVQMEDEMPNKYGNGDDHRLLFKTSLLNTPFYGNMDSASHEMMWEKARSECFEKEMIKVENHGNETRHDDQPQHQSNNPPFSNFEKWLFEDASNGGGSQVEEMMQLSPIF